VFRRKPSSRPGFRAVIDERVPSTESATVRERSVPAVAALSQRGEAPLAQGYDRLANIGWYDREWFDNWRVAGLGLLAGAGK
jgi:hypothetical protein